MSQLRFEVYKLHFPNGVSLSGGRTNDYSTSGEYLPSDTLAAALTAVGVEGGLLGNDTPDVRQFLDSFRISSGYPFKGDRLFFPKPFVRLPFTLDFGNLKDSEAKQNKQLKKINYLDQYYFEKVLVGTPERITNSDHLKGRYLARFDEHETRGFEVFESVSHERVSLQPTADNDDEAGSSPTPFLVQRVHFASDAGLYFIIQFAGTDTEAQQRNRRRFESCLQLLADSGVGTDRTSGTGWFTWKVPLDLTMTVPERANRFLNLGLYCPAVDEPALKDLQHASYELVKRGGWIASAEQTEHLSWRKKSVYMFREGSVFTHQPTGKYVDLAPDGCNHPIWRDGRPLVIPVAVTEA